MKYLLKIIFALIFIHVGSQMDAQRIAPKKSAKIDSEKVEQSREIVEEIDSMLLKCDTVFIEPFNEDSVFYQFKGICFDEQGRLRKYARNLILNDTSHDNITMYAYYDENGNLVYMVYYGSSHCDSNSEYYYVHHGLIVDFMCEVECYCCDKELSKKEINQLRPAIGSPLKTTIWDDWALTSFIRADTLLSILKSKEYNNDDELIPIRLIR